MMGSLPPVVAEPAARESSALRRVTVALSVTQLLSWGALFYGFTVVSPDMSQETGWAPATAAGAFSVGLLVSGFAAPATVRALRQRGPRLVMAGGSGLGAAGMLAWAVSPSVPTLYLAWIVIGVAMAATLYEPAMVVLVDLDPSRRRWTLSVLTAAGGLASTVFAPLTAALTDALGWRAAIAVLATAVSALTGIVHLCCLPGRSARPPDQIAGADHQVPLTRDLRRLRTAVLVEQTAYVATSAQLVGFLTARAVPLHTASAVLGTIGLGKLAGRLLLPGISTHRSLRNLAVACSLVHLVGLAVPLATTATGGLFAAAVVVGTASGASTVLRSLLVVDLAGTIAFAGVSAGLQRASSLVRAAGPFAIGLGVASLGWNTTWVLAQAAFAVAASHYAAITSA
jgi:predicted MFS family arabinose efflux permease